MGVYHVLGLGQSPGALSMPLSVVLLLQIAQQCGNEKAKNFFKHSGEVEKSGSYEMTKGGVECLIAFTSKEVIEGSKVFDCRSKWFNLNFEKGRKLEEIYSSFFGKFFNHAEKEFGVRLREFKMFLIEVNYMDFEDCFKKIGITMGALRDKEVWANMIGGSNQINSAILVAGAYTATPSKYYYLFQNNQKLLEPEWAEKPKKNNINQLVEEALNRWFELPIFNIDLGGILKDLKDLFKYRQKVNKGEVEEILENRDLDEQFFAKLRNFIISNEDGSVEKSAIFDKFVSIWEKLDLGINNFSKWKKWAENEKIIHELNVFK